MEHLNLDWLAELADREPTDEEGALLSEHPEWTEELDALRAQTDALGGLPSLRPPRGDWAALEARLMSEGLIRTRTNAWLALPLASGWTKAAAALVLFFGGTLAGASFAEGDPGSLGPHGRVGVDAGRSRTGGGGDGAAISELLGPLPRDQRHRARSGLLRGSAGTSRRVGHVGAGRSERAPARAGRSLHQPIPRQHVGRTESHRAVGSQIPGQLVLMLRAFSRVSAAASGAALLGVAAMGGAFPVSAQQGSTAVTAPGLAGGAVHHRAQLRWREPDSRELALPGVGRAPKGSRVRRRPPTR